MMNIKNNQGMTIAETLISIAIMSLVVVAAASLLIGMSGSQKRTLAITETEFQATFLINSITQSLRNSTAIASPATSSASNFISLVLPVSTGENPTRFGLSSNRILVSKAGAASTTLSSDTVSITSLQFNNVSAANTDGAVRVVLTVSYKNNTNDPKYNYSTTRYATITLR